MYRRTQVLNLKRMGSCYIVRKSIDKYWQARVVLRWARWKAQAPTTQHHSLRHASLEKFITLLTSHSREKFITFRRAGSSWHELF